MGNDEAFTKAVKSMPGTGLLDAANGKKTAAGAGLSAFTGLLVALGMIWGLDSLWWWPKTIETINLVGGAICAWGLAHKFVKWRASR